MDAEFLQALFRLLTLQDYNTRVVMLGTGCLGFAAGIVGTFLVLRKRALLSDTVSHATLPGVVFAFMLATAYGFSARNLPLLLSGALLTGVLGMLAVIGIRRYSRIKDDAALGIVLSVFFGLGIVLLGIVQHMPGANAAGLNSFIYGKPASMLLSDSVAMGILGIVVFALCAAFFKEFKLLCFDEEFARTLGWPVFALDLALMTMIVLVTVVGLQAVGLILVVSLLIIPPVAARFWSHDLGRVIPTSGIIGLVSGFVGSGLSALFERLPAGAIIVLTASSIFLFSVFFGSANGIVQRAWKQWRLAEKIRLQNLLRAAWEISEEGGVRGFAVREMLRKRTWSPRQLRSALRTSRRLGFVQGEIGDRYWLTVEGELAAARLVRNYRLWEVYLINHADVAPSHVDRDADQIEHVLDEDLIDRLELLLQAEVEKSSRMVRP